MSVHGGVVGLTVLGHSVIRNLLLPAMGVIEMRIKAFSDANLSAEGGSSRGVCFYVVVFCRVYNTVEMQANLLVFLAAAGG